MNKKLGLRIVPTYRCNMSCSYCYQETFSGSILSLDALYNSLKYLISSNFYPVYITLHGGEISFIPGVKDYIKLALKTFPHSKFSITTNGTGSIEFYRWCLSHGVNITFSDHGHIIGKSSDDDMLKAKELVKLFSSAPNTAAMRMNVYWNGNKEYLKSAYDVARQCKLGLTYCHELNEENKSRINLLQINNTICPNDDITELYNVAMTEQHIAFESDDFSFWFYRRSSEHDDSEWIVLPNGSVTSCLADLKNGRGA